MRRKSAAVILVIAVLLISVIAVLSLKLFTFTVPLTSQPNVPAVELGYPLISTGGYVNSSVEFIVTVYTYIDSQAINNISYSVDGGQPVTLTNPTLTTYQDYGPSKADFKAYSATISLKDLTEGNHTLAAYANNMSTSEFFVVNSNYHVTALHVISPASPIYMSGDVPMKFTYTGDITSAHYYLYSGQDLVSDSSISGDTTLSNLPDGSYKLLVFVTTQYGQDSEMITFFVIGFSTIAIMSVILVLSISIGMVYFRKFRHKKTETTLV